MQLPGGITLEGVPFEITERDQDGRPLMFKILPKGSKIDVGDRCALYADDAWIRSPKKG